MTTTNCGGRFPPLCATELPEVTDYDFETNLTTRGKNDRVFRWEDIYVDATWLFLEVTTSGNFEYNTLSSSITSNSGELAITYPNTSSNAYVNWTLTGGYTYYIGTSGSVLSTGNLSGYQGNQFTANPITTNESIGLWCNSSNPPRVYCTGLPYNTSGIYDNVSHQFYAQAICNKYTGNLPYLKTLVTANVGGSISGYYDPINKEWTTSYPTGSYYISTGGYTEIKYDFTTVGLSFTPDDFGILIENSVTGSFITIDDVHIDQYMKKNPFVDYILPTGYLIQITPDLGWHDVKAQFDGSSEVTNPFIKTFGPFSIDNGNLEDNLDNTVSATIDSGDYLAVIQPRYKRYLWRAIGILPNGSLGKAGLPEKFSYVGSEIELDFTVDSIDNSLLSTTKTIVGKKNNRMTILVDGESNHPGLEYPNETSWKLSINIDGISRTLRLRGKDSGGATTSERYVELSNSIEELNTRALWNVFDDHGVLLDVKRIPNESNTSYKERLIDSNVNRGNATFVGIVNGANRELGLKKISDAIYISIPKNSDGQLLHDIIEVIASSATFLARTPDMVYSERVYVDSIHSTITLSKYIHSKPSSITKDNGEEINIDKYSIDIDEDRPSIQRVKIHEECSGYVTVVYNYYESLRYKDYSTIGSLVTAINTLTDHAGIKLLNANCSLKLSGGESSLGLFITNTNLTLDSVMNIAWSPITLRKISDKEFREHYISSDGTYHKTKFQEYVSSLRRNSRTFWIDVSTDIDYWADEVPPGSFDYIPTLFDPTITFFETKDLEGNIVRMSAAEAWGRGFLGYSGEMMNNLGIDYKYFQPGVGFSSDLEPAILPIQIDYNKNINQSSYVVENMNITNTSILFSGQR